MVMDDSGVGKRNVKRPILGTAILCTLAIVLTLMLYQNPQQVSYADNRCIPVIEFWHLKPGFGCILSFNA